MLSKHLTRRSKVVECLVQIPHRVRGKRKIRNKYFSIDNQQQGIDDPTSLDSHLKGLEAEMKKTVRQCFTSLDEVNFLVSSFMDNRRTGASISYFGEILGLIPPTHRKYIFTFRLNINNI